MVADWKPTRTHSAHPVAMTNDTLWVATLQSSGTAIAEVQLTESGPVTVERVKLSDGVTRDWTLSPDGSRLAFTEQDGLDLRVRVVPLHDDDVPHLVSSRWSVAERPSSRLLGRCRSERVAGLASRWSARFRDMGRSCIGDRIHVADCLGPTRRVASASLVGRQRGRARLLESAWPSEDPMGRWSRPLTVCRLSVGGLCEVGGSGSAVGRHRAAGWWVRPRVNGCGASRPHAAPSSCPYSGGGPPFSLQSFEADPPRQLYLDTQLLAAANQLFPDDEEFQLFPLQVGEQRIEDPVGDHPSRDPPRD